MKSVLIVLLLLSMIGILFVIPQHQVLFAQIGAADQLINQLRLIHSQLLGDIDLIKQSLQSNNTSQTLNLLDDMDVKVDQMNSMFNDLVWELSNKGH